MFFAIDLLIPQHGGKFGSAWVAATRGLAYVPKKEIVRCDICKLCDEILQMVQTSSSRPRLRLSLSLASRLVNGVVKIYRRQVEITTADLQAFLAQVRVPKIDSSISLEGSPRAPVPAVRRRRRRSTLQLSIEPTALAVVPTVPVVEDFLAAIIIDEEELARPSIHQVHPDLITLREELPVRPRAEVAMGDLDVLEDVEPPVLPGALLDPAAPLPRSETSKKRKAADALGIVLKRRATAQIPQIEASKEGATEPISEEPPQFEVQVPDVSQSEVPVIHEVPEIHEVPVIHEVPAMHEVPQLDVQPTVVPELEVQSAKKIPRKRRAPGWVAKANINIRRRRRVNINRGWPGTRERMDLSAYANHVHIPLEEVIDEGLDVYRFLGLFMEESQPPEEVEELIAELRTSSRSADSLFSLSLPHLRGRVTSTLAEGTPGPSTIMPPVLEPMVSPKQHEITVQADIHEPVGFEEPMPLLEPEVPIEITKRLEVPDKTVKPLAESTGVSLPQIHRTIETVIPPAAENAGLREAIVTSISSSDVKRSLAKQRQKRIRNIVKNWNTEEQGEITLEDVCYKPVNRANIALAFNDLLSLHKMLYVKLNEKPNSLELGTIEKGERLLNKK